MNNVRIRYNKTPSGLVSARAFNIKNDLEDYYVFVEINTEDRTYTIVNADTKKPRITGGGSPNLAVLKRQAKRALIKLGVKFDKEERTSSD